MGVKLSELDEGSLIVLQVSNKDDSIPINAIIKKHVKENIAFILLADEQQQRLNFEGVQVDLEYCEDGVVPIIWHNVKVVNYKNGYVMQVSCDGQRHNRRNFFRVGISTPAKILSTTNGSRQVMVRDLSLSGFSVADRKKELSLDIGDELSIYFEDLGHSLSLIGRVVRIEEHEDFTIYGLELCNLCKDLSSYLNLKQRQKR